MFKLSRLLCCWLLLVLGITAIMAQEKAEKQKKNAGGNDINLFLYVYQEEENRRFSRLIPFYSYDVKPQHLYEDFFLWPFLAGYETAKNPIPTILPFGINLQWNTIPLLTLGGTRVYPAEHQEVSTMVSFVLMTYFQENYTQNEHFSRSWYSLPVFSFYHSETLFSKDTQLTNTTIGNPIFFLSDIRIHYREQFYPAYQWAISPFSLLLGEDSFKIAFQARWGRDYLFQLFALDIFAIFSLSTTFSYYPGAEYHRFIHHETDTNKGLEKLFAARLAYPTTRLGILSPLIQVESNPSGKISWQLLPLFYYSATNQPDRKQYQFNLLFLGLQFGSSGTRFAFVPRLFPVIYHDEAYGSWDILWPLFRYSENPAYPLQRIAMRLVFDYQNTTNSAGNNSTTLTVGEGLLFSYHSESGGRQWELLPAGLLFAYQETKAEYSWRILGFGYRETPARKFLQLLFINIPIGYKNIRR